MVARDITLMGLSLTNCSNTGPRIIAAYTPRCGQVVARKYLMIEPANREWAGLPNIKGPAAHLLKLSVFRSHKEWLGQVKAHRLNDLAESVDVNVGGCPETDGPSSRGGKPGQRRRCHSSRRPGKPATGRRAPGDRHPTRQLPLSIPEV